MDWIPSCNFVSLVVKSFEVPSTTSGRSFDNLVTGQPHLERRGKRPISRTRESNFEVCCLLWFLRRRRETPYAEHTGANLLPCNAAARLQALGASREHMSPLAEFDRRLEQVIRTFALRILVPRWTEFDAVWESANRICDRYELGRLVPERRSADLLSRQ